MGMQGRLGRDRKFRDQKLERTRERRETLELERRLADFGDGDRRNDLLPELRISSVCPSELRPSLHRSRRTTGEQLERLVTSISEFGFTVPILVAGAEIVDGHIRVEAAQRLRLDKIAAIDVAHLSKSQVRKLRLAVNRIPELGEWDLDRLRVEFEELIVLDPDFATSGIAATGFTSADLDIILLDTAGEADGDDIVEDPPAEPVTRPGDLWHLGDHRLLCGNSLVALSYATVLNGELAHAVLTDPPYNVKIAGNVSGLGKRKHREFVMASGEMTPAEWQDFLNGAVCQLAAHVAPGSVLFVFMDWRSWHRLYAAGEAARLSLVNMAIWHKPGGGMGSLYRSAHELVAVFCKGDTPRTNNVELGRHGRNRSNVWSAPGANQRGSSANEMLSAHPTAKPVELCVNAILDVTERGETVLDAFLGSGTTLVAAEKTGRRCCGIELDPGFVDVSVRRWEKLTGKQAMLADTGETFDEVMRRRAAVAAGAADDEFNADGGNDDD